MRGRPLRTYAICRNVVSSRCLLRGGAAEIPQTRRAEAIGPPLLAICALGIGYALNVTLFCRELFGNRISAFFAMM